MTSHLLIDAGNTRIKWRWTGGGTQAVGVTGMADTSAARKLPIAELAAICKLADDMVITAANVAGEIVAMRLRESVAPWPIHFITATAAACGVTNRYLNPSQLGPDRLAALIAAHHFRRPAPVARLVVMAGTALTIDALTADGVFLGGVIAPGPTLMRNALHQATAALPHATAMAGSDHIDRDAFPLDTHAAIAVGTHDALIGAILQSARRLRQHGHANCEIIASGGAMPQLLAPLASCPSLPLTIIDDLVLQGLLLLAGENTEHTAAADTSQSD